MVYFSIFWPVPPSWHRAQSAQLVSSLHVPFVDTCCFCFSPTQSSSSSFSSSPGGIGNNNTDACPITCWMLPPRKKREKQNKTQKKKQWSNNNNKNEKTWFSFSSGCCCCSCFFLFFSGDDWGEITRDLEAMILFVFSLPKRFDIKMMSLTLWFLIFHRDFTPSIDRHVHRSQLYYLANGLCPYRKENSLAVTAL